jgi:ATP-dependent RNA helicase HelY
VIQWSGNLDPASVAGLASKRSYPLISPFKPTANMAVNLIEAFGRKRAREVLETSFAQFQADRSVVGLAKGIREKQISLDGYAKSMECHLGDFFAIFKH